MTLDKCSEEQCEAMPVCSVCGMRKQPPALSVLAGGADEPAGKRGHAMTARSFLEPFVIARLAPLQTSIGVEPVATVSCVRCFRESGVYLPEILEPEDPIARWGALERARIEAARLFEAAGWRATHLGGACCPGCVALVQVVDYLSGEKGPPAPKEEG